MKQFLLFLTIYIIGIGTGAYTKIFKSSGNDSLNNCNNQLICGENQFDQYMCNDIAHIDLDKLQISFEMDTVVYKYDSIQDIYEFIEKSSAYNSTVLGYGSDITYLIENGYISINSIYNKHEKYSEMLYNGPNWTIDASRDTSYIIATFNTIEKIYDPKTKLDWLKSYNIN